MGVNFMDKYSYLHFSVGIIMYYLNVGLINSIILHTIFEWLENTDIGMKIINYISFWPGGKPYRDSYINNLGDTTFFVIGWITAYLVSNKK